MSYVAQIGDFMSGDFMSGDFLTWILKNSLDIASKIQNLQIKTD